MKVDREVKQSLVDAALVARAAAYTPYSHYPVGAAILTRSGNIYGGANIENASYPATVCAERVAVFKAVSEGEKEFVALAVVSRNGATPCGICRQVLSEFAKDLPILIANEDGAIRSETNIKLLLPEAFGPGDLEQ